MIIKKENIKEVCKNLTCTTIVTLFYPLLSPLHLAAYGSWKKEKEKKKEFKRVQKKVQTILKKSSNTSQNIDYNNDKQVFFELYNRIDSLSVQELKTLRNFCKLSYHNLNRNESLLAKNQDKIDIYNKYHEELEDKIDERKQKQKSIWRRNLHYFSKKKR